MSISSASPVWTNSPPPVLLLLLLLPLAAVTAALPLRAWPRAGEDSGIDGIWNHAGLLLGGWLRCLAMVPPDLSSDCGEAQICIEGDWASCWCWEGTTGNSGDNDGDDDDDDDDGDDDDGDDDDSDGSEDVDGEGTVVRCPAFGMASVVAYTDVSPPSEPAAAPAPTLVIGANSETNSKLFRRTFTS